MAISTTTPSGGDAVYKAEIAAIANTATATFKQGKSVYLFAADLGGYANAAAAIADVDSGGTLWIMDEYDVATHGIITIEKPVNIRGLSTSMNGSQSSANLLGSVIRNTGALANCISVNLDSVTTTDRYLDLTIDNLGIEHEGSGYAIDVETSTWVLFKDLTILCDSLGAGGIRISEASAVGSSFYIGVERVRVTNFTDIGVWFDGVLGSQNFIRNCSIRGQAAATIAGVKLSGQVDMNILDSQIDCDSVPGILVTNEAGKGAGFSTAIVIDRCLTEENTTWIKLTGDGVSNRICQDVTIRNPRATLNNDSMILVEFDYAARCSLELPMCYSNQNQYGRLGGYLANFTANSKDCSLIVDSNWGDCKYIDSGMRNTVRAAHMPDAQYIRALHNWPTGVQHTDYVETVKTALHRNSTTTFGDQTATGWYPQVGDFAAETLLGSADCVLWLDASDTTTLWQDLAGTTTQADTDGDTVLYWDDKSGNGNDFDIRVGGASGYSHTTADEATTTFSSTGSGRSPLKVTGTITIDGVTGADAASINGDWTATYVDISNFTIVINSNTLTYDSTAATVRVHDNTPLLETDCFSRGVYGILFDGVDDVFEQVDKFNTIDLDETNDVGTMILVYSPLNTSPGQEMMFGRKETDRLATNQVSAGTMVIGIEWGNDETSFNMPLAANTSTVVAVSTREDTGADWSDITYAGMDDDVSTDAGQVSAFDSAGYPWQVGSGGVSRSMFNGYVHAAFLFNRTLTEAEARELMFYLSNKFMATPVA